MVMAVFAYIYHQSFVGPQSLSIEMILDQILMNLSFKEQRALYMKLGQIIQEMQFEDFLMCFVTQVNLLLPGQIDPMNWESYFFARERDETIQIEVG
ncbi:hypothetical protein CsSME_00031166 [Camellia sinensis var. sinensis]